MRARNHIIYGEEAVLRRLKADYDFIGRPCEIQVDGNGVGRLVVFALPPKKTKSPNRGNRGRR